MLYSELLNDTEPTVGQRFIPWEVSTHIQEVVNRQGQWDKEHPILELLGLPYLLCHLSVLASLLAPKNIQVKYEM